MAKNILIGITGGIAAYKIPLLIRLLKKQGDNVRVVLSENAHEFVTPTVLQALSGEAVRCELFDATAEQGMSHIELARWADAYLIAPASANTIAKLACGLADNLLTTLYLATTAPVFIAPAMNKNMLAHPAVQNHLATLAARENHHIIAPESGAQACGDIGAGRMPEPETLLELLHLPTQQDLHGITMTITAGGTREAIDPVRYISNYSSGKMGYALARAGAARGAKVHLISAPVHLPPPADVHLISVVSAREMHAAALEYARKSDLFIAAAAVADYRPEQIATEKLKKNKTPLNRIQLVENPDIVAEIANLRECRPFTVGFAAETEHLCEYAREKLTRKNLDLIVANNVSAGVFGADDNEIVIIDRNNEKRLPRQSKMRLANHILDYVQNFLSPPL